MNDKDSKKVLTSLKVDRLFLLELMRTEALIEGDLVMCSHGDLIPEVLNRLLREGMSVIGGRGCEKGSVWTLEVRGRDIVSGTYTATP